MYLKNRIKDKSMTFESVAKPPLDGLVSKKQPESPNDFDLINHKDTHFCRSRKEKKQELNQQDKDISSNPPTITCTQNIHYIHFKLTINCRKLQLSANFCFFWTPK